ncbi:MAG: 50S ribosomal protein L21 [Alphaproteobacteria bacterium MarineAlpha5_Bin9]|nr:MAG: 50S ribosomal protein L21 [Alphaproteobacteria bacterium MarineAlpha5_Bin9]|tara:strand:+ start:13545 stop:14024 length:480 start_codon:yes stop_codon:yes gene_type:complete
MIAIFKTGGKQYSVEEGQILKVEKIEGKKGDSLKFDQILAISEKNSNNIGTPNVEGAYIQAQIIDQIRDKKIIVFKKRRRQNYRHTQGHRQYLTVLKIETISDGSKKLAKKKTTESSKSLTSDKKIQKKEVLLKDNSKTNKAKKKIVKKKVANKNKKDK